MQKFEFFFYVLFKTLNINRTTLYGTNIFYYFFLRFEYHTNNLSFYTLITKLIGDKITKFIK